MLKQFLWTACVTPFNKSGSEVDYQSFENILKLQEKNGNGIVILASTGEGLSISEEEKRKTVELACNLQLKSQIVVAVPGYNLEVAKNWIEFCNDMPISGYLIVTPIYSKPGIQGQTKWFEDLLNKSSHPAMLYNSPGRAAVKLYPEVIANLKGHKNLQAIKDSSGNIESIVEYRMANPEVSVFCGDDNMISSMAMEGAKGLVSVAANAWPDKARKYVEACISGKKVNSDIWWQAWKGNYAASHPVPLKALMADIGLIAHDTVRVPLSGADLQNRQRLVDIHKKMLDWNI